MPMNFPDYWGIRKKEETKYHTTESAKKIMEREETERQEEFKKLYSKKKPYPNATIEEVKKNAVDVPRSNQVYEYGPREQTYRKYTKGNFGYYIYGKEIKASYLPSMNQPLKIMFTWNYKSGKWDLLTYREGDW